MPQNFVACDRDQELLLPPNPEDHLAWLVLLEEAAELDAAEDELHGDARGDELPAELRVAGDRRKRQRRLIAEHDAWLAAGIASDGSRRMTGARHNLEPYPLTPMAERRINVSDPDSRNLETTRGWVQGYNAQAVVTEGQIVIAAEISTESLDRPARLLLGCAS